MPNAKERHRQQQTSSARAGLASSRAICGGDVFVLVLALNSFSSHASRHTIVSCRKTHGLRGLPPVDSTTQGTLTERIKVSVQLPRGTTTAKSFDFR